MDHIYLEGDYNPQWINCIYQDSDGFMWFGAYTGAYKYNGYSMDAYNFHPHDTTGLTNSHITTIFETKDKHILIGTIEGLNVINPENESGRRGLAHPTQHRDT